jgi:hypothetical protein
LGFLASRFLMPHSIRLLEQFFGTSSSRAAQNGSGPQQMAPRYKAKAAPLARRRLDLKLPL